ncbi:magnesium and cobalt transport protein CorA [Nocardiopsis sp. N85]|uniref:magnesium and cobalt transport protein CorA n=1 Tax=Nocardiopsis sp. N85 TaxID=3029400 RepID=UPI00237F8105|nr:magnesium and cobalt transport protein CorA [Nocardiopsis sp. N85]MDE3724946.1 magnesium and cobalt transport protein CorA [Nocardiopsis sp. N85]
MALGGSAAVVPADTGPGRMSIRLYRGGRPERDVDSAAEARDAIAAHDGLMAWIALENPDRSRLMDLARVFRLPPLALEDSIVAHQRPKGELYHDILFMVLRPAGYDEEREAVRIGEVHLFVGRDFVITITHDDRLDLDALRRDLEGEPRLLAHGPLAVLYVTLDRVVDAYAPAIASLREDIDEVETQVFSGDPEASRRTYRLAREVILLQRAVDPLGALLDELMTSLEHPDPDGPGHLRPHGDRHGGPTLLRHYLRDVADHATAVRERVDGFRQLLQNIMSVNSTLIGQSQNEAMKKVSSWGGILVVPTLISSIYGMNIAPRPGFGWAFGWPFTLALMALSSVTLYLVFRRNGWL